MLSTLGSPLRGAVSGRPAGKVGPGGRGTTVLSAAEHSTLQGSQLKHRGDQGERDALMCRGSALRAAVISGKEAGNDREGLGAGINTLLSGSDFRCAED